MKQVWKFSFQMIILIVFYQIGNQLSRFFHLQIPGNVIGIVLLLAFLSMGWIKIEQVELSAGWLLKHLGFFFIPISIGLMTLGDIFLKQGFTILLVLIISALIGLLSAGKATQFVIMKKEKGKVKVHDHDHAL
ncbi:CidA/LrgA family protein [Neobacillus pocheonensis]|uniref:CidA/LrgA family protein n=1 Tax=Neobacillus pocheonensis TaxID=363869 RepID=UPI003D28CE78